MRWGRHSLKGSFPVTMAYRMTPLGTGALKAFLPPTPCPGALPLGWLVGWHSQAP